MKKIIINEKQENMLHKHLLIEFMQPGFSFQRFLSLDHLERLYYCNEFLGYVGHGSSRMVFEIDDNHILKCAAGQKYQSGCEQNRQEWQLDKTTQSPLLVKQLYIADDSSWLVSERVVPCQSMDFYKILGIPYQSFTNVDEIEIEYQYQHPDMIGYEEYQPKTPQPNLSFEFISFIMNTMLKGNKDISQKSPEAYNIITTHPWFKELYRLCSQYNIEIGDIRLDNMGIAMRNGKPTIVILDAGLTHEIFQNHYINQQNKQQ